MIFGSLKKDSMNHDIQYFVFYIYIYRERERERERERDDSEVGRFITKAHGC